jgi:exoribonuclease R
MFETQQTYTYEEAMDDSRLSILSTIATYLAGGELQSDSHQWIEQMMLFYNKEAGTWLKKESNGVLRRHSEGNQEKLKKYQDAVPEWKHLAMMSAEYCSAEEKDTMHHGIQTDAYAHASSPIRRYADLVNQRILKQLITQKTNDYIVPVTIIDFNEREKAIKRFARDCNFIQVLESGWTYFQAIILEIIQATSFSLNQPNNNEGYLYCLVK